MSFLEAQQEILLDRVASVVENKIVLLSDVVLAANAVAAQQQINPNTNPSAYQKLLESSRESMVEQLLIIEMAEQDSVEILDKDVDKALDQQIENIISQTGSKEQAEAALGKKISDFKPNVVINCAGWISKLSAFLTNYLHDLEHYFLFYIMKTNPISCLSMRIDKKL